MNNLRRNIRLGLGGFALMLGGLCGLYGLGTGGSLQAQTVQGQMVQGASSESVSTPALRLELSVEDCRQMALQNSMAVKNARLDILSARAQKQEALAAYFPSVSAGFRIRCLAAHA